LEIIYGSKTPISNHDSIYVTESDIISFFDIGSYQRATNVISDVEETQINGTKFPQLFKYSDTSLWWFMYPTIFPSINRILDFIVEFEKIIKDKKLASVKVEGDFSKLGIIAQLCQKWEIKLSYSKFNYFMHLFKKYFRSKLDKYIFYYIHSKKNKKRLSIFKSKSKKRISLKGRVIFAVPTLYRRSVYDSATEKTTSREYIQGPIMDIVKRMKLDVAGIDLDYTFRGRSRILEERLMDSTPWFPVEHVVEYFSQQKNFNDFLKKYTNMIQSDAFSSLFVFNKINFWDQVKDDFRKLTYEPHLPTYMKMIEGFTNLFKKEKPRAVFLPYEQGPLALSIIIACERSGVPSIGIQHGVMYKNDPEYAHDDFRSKSNPFGMPLPDFTLLFGNYMKKALTEEGKYPPEKYVVFGNPEFFCLDKLLKNLESANLLKKYNIPPTENVILFTSSKLQKYYRVYGGVSYDEQVWRYLLKNFGNKEKFFIILKPHPDENTMIYEKIMEEYAPRNVKIIEGQLFELLYLSSVVISIISTTLLDSLCLRKPTIRVKFEEMRPLLPYDEYQVLLSTPLDNLSEAVLELLSNKDLRNKLLENSIHFIKEQYNIPEDNNDTVIARILA